MFGIGKSNKDNMELLDTEAHNKKHGIASDQITDRSPMGTFKQVGNITHIEPPPPPIAKIALALSKAQVSFPEIKKNQSMEIRGRKTYWYADLAAIIKAVVPALSENGIAFIQTPKMSNGILTVVTRFLHESGEELFGEMSVPVEPDGRLQELGSVITYLRRYLLTAMSGVAAEDDTDGNTEKAEVSDNKPQTMANDKMGEQVKEILVALDNADFFATLPDQWKESFSHMFTTKNGNALGDDKWKDITEVVDHIDLVAMSHRKNIAKGAKFIEKEMDKFKKGGK